MNLDQVRDAVTVLVFGLLATLANIGLTLLIFHLTAGGAR